MRLVAIALSMVLTLLTAAAPAPAQDRRSFGATFAFPGPVGIVWQPADRVGVRTTVSFAFNGTEESNGLESDGSSITLTVGGLFYLRPSGTFRAYLSPRYIYSRSSMTSSIEISSLSPTLTITTLAVTIDSTSRSHGGAGLAGVEYRLSERFAVFGESGLLYSHSRSAEEMSGGFPTIPVSSHRWTFGSTGGVGLAVYF